MMMMMVQVSTSRESAFQTSVKFIQKVLCSHRVTEKSVFLKEEGGL